MDIETVFLFITLCGLIGTFLRRNLLNIITSLGQVALGLSALFSYKMAIIAKDNLAIYLLLFLLLALIFFSYAVALLMIRRRSTLQINELTELRG